MPLVCAELASKLISTSPFTTAQEKVTLMLMFYLEFLLMTWLT